MSMMMVMRMRKKGATLTIRDGLRRKEGVTMTKDNDNGKEREAVVVVMHI